MLFHVVFSSCLSIVLAARDTEFQQFVPRDYLKWNYSHVSPNCISAGGGRNPCQDVRVCNFALASVSMGGWPTLCGWVGKGVPKVCCGLPLVLGEKLMKQVDKEKSKNRECGRKTMSGGLSATENRFYNILKSMPPPNIKNPHKFDPPLDLTEDRTVIPPAKLKPDVPFYPWIVAVYKGTELVCGGTLIDRDHVLSAANCFTNNGENPDLYSVQVGDLGIVEGYPYSLNDIKVHENYVRGDLNNNLAILTLSEEIESPMFPHICLPSSESASKNLAGIKATHLEWSYESIRGDVVPKLSVIEDVSVIPMRECQLAYSQYNMNVSTPLGKKEKLFCAGWSDGSGHNCKITAGGPLMFQEKDENLSPSHREFSWMQIGVVSVGYHCGIPQTPLVYTKVSSHMDWIIEHTKPLLHPQ